MFNRILPPGSFLRNAATLIGGTTFSQILLMLASPILARLYVPAEFGIFSMYSSIAGIFSVILCLRYELAIVLPQKEEDAANLMFLSLFLCISLCLISQILIHFFFSDISCLLNKPELGFWLKLLPISLFSIGIMQVCNYWITRKKNFKLLATRGILQSCVTSFGQISLGFAYHNGSGGLIGGSIVGSMVASICLVYNIVVTEGKSLIGFFSIKKIFEMLVAYKDFPIYSTWSSWLNTSSIMMPPLLLGYYFTPDVVGFYALGLKVIQMPMSFIGSAVAQVFYSRATDAKRAGNLGGLSFNIFKHLIQIGMVPIIFLSIIAPDVFAIVFGYKWIVAGQYLRWFSVWMFFNFISSPMSMLFLVLGKQRTGLIINFIVFISRFMSIVVGGIMEDSGLAIGLLGVTGGVIWGFNSLYIMYLSGVQFSVTFSEIYRQFVKSLPYFAILALTVFVFKKPLWSVLVAGVAGFVFLLQNYGEFKRAYALKN